MIAENKEIVHHCFTSEIPPANIEAEEAVLGAILLDPDAIATATAILPPEAFSLQAHSTIYKAAIALHQENKPTDLLQLTTHLNDKKRLKEIGGQSKLATLVDRTVSTANISQYIDLVIEKYNLRLQQGIGSDLAAGRLSLGEARAELEKLYKQQQSNDPSERLAKEIQDLAKESNSINYKIKLADLCRRSKLSRRDIEQEIASLTTKRINKEAQLISGKDFLTMELGGGVRWLFPGIIPALGVSLWGGNAGVGKTTLANDAGVSLIKGEEFLGEKPTKKGKVLFVCADELPGYAQEKLIDRGIPSEDSWDVLLHWDVSQWSLLIQAVERLRPDLIIMDCFASIHRDSAFDENSSLARLTAYRLEDLSDAYKCGIILLHHLNKNPDAKGVNKFRGASAIVAAVSTAAIFEQSPNGETRYFHFPKIRGAEPGQYVVELDRMTSRYKVHSGGPDEETKSLTERILAFFKTSPAGRFEFSEIKNAIAAEVDGIRKALGRLVQRGQIIRRPSAVDSRFKVWGLRDFLLTNDSENNECPVPETQAEQRLQILDTILDTPEKILDTFECPVPENQIEQGFPILDTNTGQEIEASSPQLSSTELKWLLQLLSDMEGSKDAGIVHPRFTSEEQVNKLYEKAVLKGDQCMEQLLATCSEYWDKLNDAINVVHNLLDEMDLRPGQRVKVGSHYGHLSAKNCVGWFVTWDKLSSSEVKRIGEPPAGAIAPEQIQLA